MRDNLNKEDNIPVIKIGNCEIGQKKPVFIIAEIGVNHNGNIDIAKKLISAAKDAGANAVKFQKRLLKAAYQKDLLSDPNYYGQSFQYLIPLLKDFEFQKTQYKELVDYCKEKEIIFLCTPFDEPSVDFLDQFNVDAYKVASADLVNFVLLEKLLKKKKPLILSVGMATEKEISSTVEFLKSNKAKFTLLHCQSTYPAAFNTINLRFISKLADVYKIPVGYSGHERGFFPSLAAVSLGASVLERHITLNKNAEGPDHAASLEPDEFKNMVSAVREIESSLGESLKIISRGEVANKDNLRKSLAAVLDIREGEIISREMITAKGPGRGLSPQYLYDILGKKAKRAIKKDDFFYESDLFKVRRASLNFKNQGENWGIKTRFHEFENLLKQFPNIPFVEFHLTDKDLDFKFSENKKFKQKFYFHAPEYFGRKIVDLCSSNDKLWLESIDVIQKTIYKARELARLFNGEPSIILHMGGMTLSSEKNKQFFINRAKKALQRLDRDGVVILPENMPPFGWFFGGSWNINAFVDCEDMVNFCGELRLNMCFDFSHGWLASKFLNHDYLKYIKNCAPYIEYLHIADAKGISGEGLQIGEGEIPFAQAFDVLQKNLPGDKKIKWVPEIWNGHFYDYKGFRDAFKKLSKYKFLER